MRWSAWGATAMAVLFALALAWRPNISTDTGYHLAYGETFLRAGHIIDGHDFVYTELDPQALARPGNCPPGAWVASADQGYRFPNANYASQIVMALAFRVGGWTGLSLLQVVLVAVVWALLILAMRARGVPVLVIAGASLLAAVVASERFALRPELFGYTFLAGIVLLLALARRHPRVLIALPPVHWLFVQFHSYWLLGLAIAGAYLAGEALSIAWPARERSDGTARGEAARIPDDSPAGDRETRVRCVRRLAIAFAGMVVVTFINPWSWRLVLLPFQTLLFFRAQGIPTAVAQAQAHPWAQIAELRGPFEGAIVHARATYGFVLMLALSAAGALAAGSRRSWAWVVVLAGTTLVSLSARRNIAPATLVAVPVAFSAMTDAWRGVRPPAEPAALASLSRHGRELAVGAATVIAGLALFWTAMVVNGYYYAAERSPYRFGGGPGILGLPLDAAQKLTRLPPEPRVFTSYNTSSTILFFARPGVPASAAPVRMPRFREVPLLTNSWAYPVSAMAENMELCLGRQSFAAFAERYDVGYAVLDCSAQNAPLIQILLADSTWMPLDFDGVNILLARAHLTPAEERCDLRDATALIARLETRDPVPTHALHRAGTSLALIGLEEAAEQVWHRCLALDARYSDAWASLGAILSRRGFRCGAQGDYTGARHDLEEAQRCLQRALELRPRYASARDNLRTVEQALGRLRAGPR